jgi:UDP:flavonoid glycosyltransferase YjiC (YdhE family)
MTDRYNAYRAALGLPRVESSPESSPLIGDLHLLRSVPELADQSYLPRQVRHVGPLLWDMPSSHARLDSFIALHRAAGRPVVYVQIGRLFEDFPAWEPVLTALGRVQVDAILDIGRSDFMGSPPRVPGNCFLTRYVPLGDIADRVSLVVCSAQTTSVLASIFHGKPLLAIPHSTDSQELASRVGAKGLARVIVDRANLTAAELEAHFETLSQGSGCPATARFQALFREYDDERVYRVLSSVLA